MYCEFFTNTINDSTCQAETHDYECFEVQFNGEATARFLLFNDDEDKTDIKKHIAVEIERGDAIKIAKGILLALNAL